MAVANSVEIVLDKNSSFTVTERAATLIREMVHQLTLIQDINGTPQGALRISWGAGEDMHVRFVIEKHSSA